MFQIVVITKSVNPNTPNIVLTYNTKASAASEHDRLRLAMDNDVVLRLADDYGYVACIRTNDIMHQLLIDLEEAEICRLEQNLHNARVGKKLMDRVNTNPEETALLKVMMNGKDNHTPARSSIIQ